LRRQLTHPANRHWEQSVRGLRFSQLRPILLRTSWSRSRVRLRRFLHMLRDVVHVVQWRSLECTVDGQGQTPGVEVID
jgi:protein involved in polysaccharide export with SLBB domain